MLLRLLVGLQKPNTYARVLLLHLHFKRLSFQVLMRLFYLEIVAF